MRSRAAPRTRRPNNIRALVHDLLEGGVRDVDVLHAAVNREFPFKCAARSYVVTIRRDWLTSRFAPDGDDGVTVRLVGLGDPDEPG